MRLERAHLRRASTSRLIDFLLVTIDESDDALDEIVVVLEFISYNFTVYICNGFKRSLVSLLTLHTACFHNRAATRQVRLMNNSRSLATYRARINYTREVGIMKSLKETWKVTRCTSSRAITCSWE